MTENEKQNRRHKRKLKRLLDEKYKNIKTFCDEVGVCDRTMYTYFNEIDKTLKQDTFLTVCNALGYNPFVVFNSQNNTTKPVKKNDNELSLIELAIELIPNQYWHIDPTADRDYCRLSFQVCNVLMVIDLHHNLTIYSSEIDQETGIADVSHSIENIEIVDFQISRHKGQGFEFSDETYRLLTEQILLKIISENE